MIPILYDGDLSGALANNNGIGRLADCESCNVTEERNGEYTLELEIPANGRHAGELKPGRIIKALTKTGLQLFRIDRATPNMNSVPVYANHISYDLSFYPVNPFTISSSSRPNPSTWMTALFANIALTCPFTQDTESYQTSGSGGWTVRLPSSVRALIGNGNNSFLHRWDGEFKWDNTEVIWRRERGSDKGVTIRYGKNLLDIEQETNIAETVCGVLPYWANSSTVVVGDIQYSENASSFPFLKTKVVDLSSSFTSAPSKADLNTVAQLYISRENIGVPEVSTEISFYQLLNELGDLKVIEDIDLCDTVTVYFQRLGIQTKAKVVKTVFNVLLERYETITLGTVKKNLADTVAALM